MLAIRAAGAATGTLEAFVSPANAYASTEQNGIKRNEMKQMGNKTNDENGNSFHT